MDEELDLHGEVCPYTFVKSKLALEEMAIGQILRVVVDNPSSRRECAAEPAERGARGVGRLSDGSARVGDHRKESPLMDSEGARRPPSGVSTRMSPSTLTG